MTSNRLVVLFLFGSVICASGQLVLRGLGKRCNGPTTVCVNNLVCRGASGAKTCKRLVGRAKDCTDGSKYQCKSNFLCESNGGDATMKTCKVPRGTYKPCGNKQFTCKSFLQCRNGYCARTVPLGAYCDNKGRYCAKNATCRGAEMYKKCKKRLTQGQSRCNNKGKFFCAAGLDCVDNKCVSKVGAGEPCNGAGRVCATGYSCRGPSGAKTCKFPGLGSTYMCGPTKYTFSTETKADVEYEGGLTGVHRYTYDAEDRETRGKYGVIDAPQSSCSPGGPAPGNFNWYGWYKFTFEMGFQKGSRRWVNCRGEADRDLCTLVE